MIRIFGEVVKKQKNFWNQCLFHPTDAIEDPWGKRILDKLAEDKAINTVRIYAMLEDIVYIGDDGELCFDFRLSDLRLDYMVEKGYELLLAYGGIPDCIASSSANKTAVAKNKTRYKGKLWNSAPPSDYALWERICFEYTKHIVERYGVETVSKWRFQCFNEPDISAFFFSEKKDDEESTLSYRLPAYCKLYEAFARGVCRVSDKLTVGGPALAYRTKFLTGLLDYVKKNAIRLDFISVHNYGATPDGLNSGKESFNVKNNMDKHKLYVDTVRECGFGDIPLLVDEWGMATAGFWNCEECPMLLARETEVFSAYFAKLIYAFTYSDYKIDMLCICLSGQHEMVEDFSGFRNFFTLNFIKKPIYNAYILANKLGESILSAETEENIFVLPTKDDNGNYAVMLSYSSESFGEDIPTVTKMVYFDENVSGKAVSVWCIDKNTANPYRLWEREGRARIEGELLKRLREEGTIKPVKSFCASESFVELTFTPNSTFLITVE